MTKAFYTAPDFARAAGCSQRTARRFLRAYTGRHREAHVRMDEQEFAEAVAALNAARGGDCRIQKPMPLHARTPNAPLKRPVASRRRFSRERKAAVLEAYALVGNATDAARAAGCSPRTARRWVREMEGGVRCQNA